MLLSCKKDDISLNSSAYNTSLTENWMQDLIAKYPDKDITLKDICLPRAHDAGIYVLNNCVGGNDCNTKTQYLDMAAMLSTGMRVFDVRPTLINGVYWTYHRTSCGGFGCEGVELRTFLKETKDYLDTHNELLIFEMGHLCNTGSQDPALIALINDVLGSTKYTLNTSLSSEFINTPLKDIIPASESTGKVVLLWDGVESASENRSEGIFSNDFIPLVGRYANNKDIDIVIADQLVKFNNFDETSNGLFMFNYTFTLDAGATMACISLFESAISIESISLDGRDRLAATIDKWIADETITPDKIPNILSIDFGNTIVTEQSIRLSELSLR
jgi:hypothetical protein